MTLSWVVDAPRELVWRASIYDGTHGHSRVLLRQIVAPSLLIYDNE